MLPAGFPSYFFRKLALGHVLQHRAFIACRACAMGRAFIVELANEGA